MNIFWHIQEFFSNNWISCSNDQRQWFWTYTFILPICLIYVLQGIITISIIWFHLLWMYILSMRCVWDVMAVRAYIKSMEKAFEMSHHFTQIQIHSKCMCWKIKSQRLIHANTWNRREAVWTVHFPHVYKHFDMFVGTRLNVQTHNYTIQMAEARTTRFNFILSGISLFIKWLSPISRMNDVNKFTEYYFIIMLKFSRNFTPYLMMFDWWELQTFFE